MARPILIGSGAYRSGRDIDVITPDTTLLIRDETDEIDKHIDIHHATPGSTNEDIYNFLNNSKFIKSTGKYIIAPPIISYILLKSHIHRILRPASSHVENVRLWERHVDDYTMFREKLDYTFLDTLIYEDKKSFYSKLFFKRFDETNKRVHDTTQNFENEENFFNDNVKRVIPHDVLHQHIAKFFRKTEQTLFSKFIVTGVEMDETLFKAASREEQIQTLIEEICVLLLERHVIPLLVSTKTNLDHGQLLNALRDVRSHFICNLCGSGHYWLRNFCLDHWKFLQPDSIYRLEELQTLAIKLCDIKIEKKQTKYSFTQFYLKYVDELVKSHESRSDMFKYHDEYRVTATSIAKKFAFGVRPTETTHYNAIEQYVLFDCKTKTYYQPESVKLITSIKFPENVFSCMAIVIDDITNPTHCLLMNNDGGFYYDGTNEYLLFKYFYIVESGQGEFTGCMAKVQSVDETETLLDAVKEMWVDSFEKEHLSRYLPRFHCSLFGSTLECGHQGHYTEDYILNRQYHDEKMFSLFEAYFLKVTRYKELVTENLAHVSDEEKRVLGL